MCKKRFIDKYRDYWDRPFSTLESVGCTNPFDKIAVYGLRILHGILIACGYSILIATAIIWLPIYGLYCWITERRYKE